MSLVVLAPLAVLAVALGVTAWLATRVVRSVSRLQAELTVLARLGAACELLVADVDRTRRTFHRTGNAPADVWPPGPGR